MKKISLILSFLVFGALSCSCSHRKPIRPGKFRQDEYKALGTMTESESMRVSRICKADAEFTLPRAVGCEVHAFFSGRIFLKSRTDFHFDQLGGRT